MILGCDLLFLIIYGNCFIISISIRLVDDLHIECLGCTVPFSGGLRGIITLPMVVSKAPIKATSR